MDYLPENMISIFDENCSKNPDFENLFAGKTNCKALTPK